MEPSTPTIDEIRNNDVQQLINTFFDSDINTNSSSLTITTNENELMKSTNQLTNELIDCIINWGQSILPPFLKN